MRITVVLFLASYLLSFGANAERITLEAKDGFKLAANFVDGGASVKSGVLMLHQCNSDKSMYSDLAAALAKKNISSLALDFRGFAESTNATVDRKVMRAASKSREEFISKLREVNKHWPGDVELAYQFLVNKVGSSNISFIGASCGGGQALRLAQQYKPKSFIFFSSGMDETNIKRFEKVSDIPAMIIAAKGDEYTYKSSHVIYKKAKTKATELKLYKSDGHGHPLFKEDPQLEQYMVDWFIKFSN